jgi:hypothetical protein
MVGKLLKRALAAATLTLLVFGTLWMLAQVNGYASQEQSSQRCQFAHSDLSNQPYYC